MIFTAQVVSKTDRLHVKLLGLDQDGIAKQIQGARGLAMGDMTPGTHKTRHGPHHQRWSSPQDQGVHRKATRCDIV